jgi:precorrin-8X/cobalt-precorrin-8 methylmutase
MPLFDRYIAVDWSANNGPKSGKDSIWIAERTRDHAELSINPRTRHAAMLHVATRLELAVAAGERVLVGFDFPFGYPAGAASALSGRAAWGSLWSLITDEIADTDANISNRFAVASRFNGRLGQAGPRFWGCPVSAANEHLSTRKVGARFDVIQEFRTVERVANGAKSTWQLFYNGSVGSQCLLGIARLQWLRQHPTLGPRLAVWPFETRFDHDLDAQIVLAEIYPSLGKHDPTITPKDRGQVEAQVRLYSDLDRSDRLRTALSLPSDFVGRTDISIAEEGWIVGAGHPGLIA